MENHVMSIKRFRIILALVVVVAAVPAMAQQKMPVQPQQPAVKPLPAAPDSIAVSSSQVTPTAEMWLYEQQLREYLDPALAVRRNAESRGEQRRKRMASLKWFGFSNQRPTAAPDPYNGEYSPSWAGNNNLYPSRWSGQGTPWIVLRPGMGTY
jgi:hypothetical protein